MASFKLMKLPLLIQRLVIILLEIDQARFKNMFKLAKVEVENVEFFLDTECYVTVSCGEESLRMSLCEGLDANIIEMKNGDDISETTIFWKYESSESQLDVLEELYDYLTSLLKIKSFDICIRNITNLQTLFLWKLESKLNMVSFVFFNVSAEDLTFVLENVSCKHLRLNAETTLRKYSKPIKFEKVYISNSSFIDWENFTLHPDTKEFTAYVGNGNETMINSVFKSWLNGNNANLEQLHFRTISFPGMNVEMVKDGITKVSNPIISQNWIDEHVVGGSHDFCEEISRPSDGRRAILALHSLKAELYVFPAQ
ncbi:unnamed protein product [Caenorhabditis brenneri]